MATDTTLTENQLLEALDTPPEAPPAGSEPVIGSLAAIPADASLVQVDEIERALNEIEGKPTAPAPAPDVFKDAPAPAAPAAAGAGEAPPKPAGLKFVVGKKSKAGDGDAPTIPATPAPEPRKSEPKSSTPIPVPAGAVSAPSTMYRASRQAYRGVENALEVMSRPVARLGRGWLSVVGAFGVTTIAVSVASMVVLPSVFPHEDAVTYLARRRDAVEHPPAPPAAAEEGEGRGEAGGHGKAPAKKDAHAKSDGHGGASKSAGQDGAKKPEGHGESKKPDAHGKAKKSEGHGGGAKSAEQKPKGGAAKPQKDAHGGGH